MQLYSFDIGISANILQSCDHGPRQPWHDLHCKIEGPAAYDILKNFEQRWKKATKWRNFRLKKVTQWHDDALIRIERISWMLNPSSGPDGDQNVRVSDEKDPDNWHVQVGRKMFRIIYLHHPLLHKL
jgi:phospholipase D1/2